MRYHAALIFLRYQIFQDTTKLTKDCGGIDV